MRWALGLLALVIAMAIVLHLSATSSKRSLDAVAGGVPELSENVAPQTFDAEAAARLADRLEGLLDERSLPESELADAARQAAGWAAATTPGTPSYRAAVKLRAAAVELRASSSPRDRHRENARRALADARAALSGGGPPPTGVDAIRDQIENLQRSQQQRTQDVEQGLR